MEVSRQLDAPADFSRRSLNGKLGGRQSRSGRFGMQRSAAELNNFVQAKRQTAVHVSQCHVNE